MRQLQAVAVHPQAPGPRPQAPAGCRAAPAAHTKRAASHRPPCPVFPSSLPRLPGKGAFGVVRHVVEKETGQSYACKSISKAKLITKEDVDDVRR